MEKHTVPELRKITQTQNIKLPGGYVKKDDLIKLILEKAKEDCFIVEIKTRPVYTPPVRRTGDKDVLLRFQNKKAVVELEYAKNKPLCELFEVYSNKVFSTNPYKFIFDGEVLEGSGTCYLYGLEDGDVIDVL